MRTFPILGTDQWAPYDLVFKHEKQAILNHGGQTIERLKERGGLTFEELYFVLSDSTFKPNANIDSCRDFVIAEVDDYNKHLFNKIIEAKKLGLRRCQVLKKLANRKVSVIDAYFHRWFDGEIDLIDVTKSPRNTKIKCVKALVEYEDGTMDETHYKNIIFTDRGES